MLERRQKLIDLARKFQALPIPSPPKARRKIAIDALLRWAFCEELPKAAPPDRQGPAGFGSVAYGIFSNGFVCHDLSRLNQFGVVSDLLAQAAPHLDARAVAKAVLELDRLDLCLPEEWDPFGDLDGMGDHRAPSIAAVVDRLCVTDVNGERRLRNPVSELMLRSAILGAPDWAIDPVAVRFVCGGNGRPRWFVRRMIETDTGSFEIEADGMSSSKKRPLAGAYRKTYLDPDPLEAGIARGEFEIWHAALGILAEELAEKCDSFEIGPCGLPARPWEMAAGGPRVGIILRDLSKL